MSRRRARAALCTAAVIDSVTYGAARQAGGYRLREGPSGATATPTVVRPRKGHVLQNSMHGLTSED
jgi:hypothetical protein